MADTANATPTTSENTTSRFTFGLVLDVAKVLEDHGYGPFDGNGCVELNVHLLHFLHGAEDGYDRCYGRTVPASGPTPDPLDERCGGVER